MIEILILDNQTTRPVQIVTNFIFWWKGLSGFSRLQVLIGELIKQKGIKACAANPPRKFEVDEIENRTNEKYIEL